MANIYDMQDTWNNVGTTFTAIKMDVTDDASNAGSLLLDLKVDGVTQASINKFGGLTVTTADINGGTIDNAVIGGATPAAGTFTALTASSIDYPAADGTAGQVLVTDGSGTLSFADAGAGGKFESYAILYDEKTAATGGGTFTSGSYVTRDLNQEVDSDGIVTLSSNQFTLEAGSYLIKWSAPGFYVNRHSTRLRNVTDSTDSGFGSSEISANGVTVASTRSTGSVRVTVGSSKTFEIQHQCSDTRLTTGFGMNAIFQTSIYTIVEIFKEA